MRSNETHQSRESTRHGLSVITNHFEMPEWIQKRDHNAKERIYTGHCTVLPDSVSDNILSYRRGVVSNQEIRAVS